MMPAHIQFWILEAAFRSLLMGVAVWAGIRALRVQAVAAQKVAWVLVLLAAVVMPLVMRSPWLALDKALRIPVRTRPAEAQPEQTQPQVVTASQVSKSAQAFVLSQPSLNLFQPGSSRYLIRPTHRSQKPARRAEHNSSSPAILSAQVAEPAAAEPVAKLISPTAITPAPAKSSLFTWASMKSALTMLYLGVASLLLLRILTGLAIAFRIWHRSKPAEISAAFSELQVRRVRISPDLTTPFTIGSTVLLPADHADWDEAKLRIVLAHEQSHVQQRDFYLQLFAALHAAIFWFSPLGWWLQRKLSELGEALSDRAGLEQAPNPSSYAQVLLEFAARPRTHNFVRPLAGVAMAPTSNLSNRIERILNASRFRLAFRGSRAHAVLAATLVPAALVAVVACIRFVPAVDAAQAQVASVAPSVGVVAPAALVVPSVVAPSADAMPAPKAPDAFSGQVSAPDQITSVDSGQEPAPAPPAPGVAPVAPNPPAASDVEAPPTPEAAPEPNADAAPVPPAAPHPPRSHIRVYNDDDDNGESFAIVRGDESNVVEMNGHSNEEFKKIRKQYHGNYIWFMRDGKSYVITDPAIFAQTQSFFKGDEALNRQMAQLEQQQKRLQEKMDLLQPEMDQARLPGPEFEGQMAKLRQQLAVLQSDEYKKLTDQIAKQIADSKKGIDEATLQMTQEKLGQLQEKIGDIQGQIGEIQGQIGERQGRVGEKQGELGEQMGRIGEQMGRIGEQQGREAEEAARRMKSVFDQAVGDGRAKPVE